MQHKKLLFRQCNTISHQGGIFSPLPPTLIDHPVGAFLHNVEALARDILYEFTLKLYECLFITKNENVRPIKKLTRILLFFFSDPLGIVVYNDLPDGATCFNRTLATRDSSRSCPGPSTSSTTLKSSRTMQRINRPSSSIRSAAPQNLIYETVDKPAQVR